MDGENNGKPYEQMDYLGVPLFLETPIWHLKISGCKMIHFLSKWSLFLGGGTFVILFFRGCYPYRKRGTWETYCRSKHPCRVFGRWLPLVQNLGKDFFGGFPRFQPGGGTSMYSMVGTVKNSSVVPGIKV